MDWVFRHRTWLLHVLSRERLVLAMCHAIPIIFTNFLPKRHLCISTRWSALKGRSCPIADCAHKLLRKHLRSVEWLYVTWQQLCNRCHRQWVHSVSVPRVLASGRGACERQVLPASRQWPRSACLRSLHTGASTWRIAGGTHHHGRGCDHGRARGR